MEILLFFLSIIAAGVTATALFGMFALITFWWREEIVMRLRGYYWGRPSRHEDYTWMKHEERK